MRPIFATSTVPHHRFPLNFQANVGRRESPARAAAPSSCTICSCDFWCDIGAAESSDISWFFWRGGVAVRQTRPAPSVHGAALLAAFAGEERRRGPCQGVPLAQAVILRGPRKGSEHCLSGQGRPQGTSLFGGGERLLRPGQGTFLLRRNAFAERLLEGRPGGDAWRCAEGVSGGQRSNE